MAGSSLQKSALELALEANDVNLMRSVIDGGANVNEQNQDGNTALHLALSGDKDVDILSLLLSKGAETTIENNFGDSPLHCVHFDSSDTILNVLKLAKIYDLKDKNKNTILHVLLKGSLGSDITEANLSKIDNFWDLIFDETQSISLDFNAQNELGETVLHVAAGTYNAIQHLTLVMSQCDDLNVLLQDYEGRTFIHVYFNSTCIARDQGDVNFINFLLNGMFQCLSIPNLKEVLILRDKYSLTPLHLFLRNPLRRINVELLNIFLKAGADLKLRNAFGQTTLHCVVQNLEHEGLDDLSEDEIVATINYMIWCGEDVNASDQNGDSPLFYAYRPIIIKHLLDMGSNVNHRNFLGQTPLLAYSCYTEKGGRRFSLTANDIHVFQILLRNGAEINACDIHANSVLHYIAWNSLPCEMVSFLRQYDIKPSVDDIGQLPCNVAKLRRNQALFEMLCECDKTAHESDENFTFQADVVECSKLLNEKWKYIECISKRSEAINETNISSLLKIPEIGSVVFKGEADNVRKCVLSLVNEICKEIAETDEVLSNIIFQSGSVGENTKVGLPDEFDFVCTLDKISECCEIDENANCKTGYACLVLKTEFLHPKFRQYFDAHGRLSTYKIWLRFKTVLREVLYKSSAFGATNIRFASDHIKNVTFPTCQFTVQWFGSFYKYLEINIDLVPVCQVKGFVPKGSNIDSLKCDANDCKIDGFLLLLQTYDKENKEHASCLRISGLKAEKMHMLALPQIAQDAYKVSKIMRDKRLCPTIESFLRTGAEDCITSYMMKNCMFAVYNANKSHFDRLGMLGYYEDRDLHKFVVQIFNTFYKCSSEKNLKSFLFPWQNIFTFAVNSEDDIHELCTYRGVYAQLILAILGQEEDLDMIDFDVLCKTSFLEYDESDTEDIDWEEHDM